MEKPEKIIAAVMADLPIYVQRAYSRMHKAESDARKASAIKEVE